MSLSEHRFHTWLSDYGRAWKAQNAVAFARLFTDAGALHYRSPFEEPKRGREEIAAAFATDVGDQRDIDFGARILYVQTQLGAAHWSCAYTAARTGRRVHLDGILVAQFDESCRALSLRQWWHSDGR